MTLGRGRLDELVDVHAGERHSSSERYTLEDRRMITDAPIKRPKLAVLKIRGGQASDVVVCCREVFGLSTHWVEGRSYVCSGADCPACCQCWPSRWAGFLTVRIIGPASRAPMLLELSGSAWDRLSGLMRMEGYESIEAVVLHASRRKAKSPLQLDPVTIAKETAGRLIEDHAAWSAISVLYGLPQPRPDESIAVWNSRCEQAASRLIELAIVRASR